MTIGKDFAEKIDSLVCARVKSLRILKGLSRKQLGAKIGTTQQQLSKYEHGVNRISSGKIAAIAVALDKPVSFFFDGNEGSENVFTGEHERLCIEVSRNFMKISKPSLRVAVSKMIAAMANN